jgi:hypothetical protein
MPTKQTEIRSTFFDYLFGSDNGYLCIGLIDPKLAERKLKQRFFDWPTQKKNVLDYIEKNSTGNNVYFCTSLLDDKQRRKENCLPGRLVWADLDTCKPEYVNPYPSVVLQSSPSRYQALWRLDSTVPPDVQEDYSKRIAYAYNHNGADPSGWDLTQLLRVPLTFNYNYDDPAEVLLLSATETPVDSDVFEQMEVDALREDTGDDAFDQPFPDADTLPTVDSILYKYQVDLGKTAFASLYTTPPDPDENWSGLLWRLISICIEAGMTTIEAYTIASTAACNKYARDRRHPKHLWRDVLKNDVQHRKLVTIMDAKSMLKMPELVPQDAGNECFIDVYKEWASASTDAPTQYHELGAAMLLSATLADTIKIPTNWGTIIPNLWGLVLGDSSLARKSTSMTMVTDIINTVDDDTMLATGGTAEGIMSGLSSRPHKTSLMYMDEVSRLFDEINRKDYLAGFPETLTLLYDSPAFLTRMLRRDTITVTNPVFIFFGGGIRDRVYELVNESYVLSGFLPRFLVVSGEADLSRMRLTGPPTTANVDRRTAIVDQLVEVHTNYTKYGNLLGNKLTIPIKQEAHLTTKAWELFNHIESTLTYEANNSAMKDLAVPTFIRMAFSCLKLGVLLAAVRQNPGKDDTIKVTDVDMTNAARYIQRWGQDSVALLHNAGRTQSEHQLQKLLKSVKNKPGVTKSELMQNHKLWARDIDNILETLIQRGDIRIKKEGRGIRIWPT